MHRSKLTYDVDKGFKVMPSLCNDDTSNVEFQENWGRVWYEILARLSSAYTISIHKFFLII